MEDKDKICGAIYTKNEDGSIHLRVCYKRSPCPKHNWQLEKNLPKESE